MGSLHRTSGVCDETGGEGLPPKKSWLSRVTSRPTGVASPSLTWGAAIARESNELNRTWGRMTGEGNEAAVEVPPFTAGRRRYESDLYT